MLQSNPASMTTYPCGHSVEANFEPPAECPLCSKYGDKMPSKAKIKERLDGAYRVKPIVPTGRVLLRDELTAWPERYHDHWPAYELTIEGWHPLRLNRAIRHWSVMKTAKEDAIRMFTLAAQVAGCPAATGQRVLHLRLEGFRIKPDADAFDKVVLDALVRSGLLINDDAAGLLGRMGFEAVLGKERRTVLLIGEVE